MKKLSHTDLKGNARMTDVTKKHPSNRTASASGKVLVSNDVFDAIKKNEIKKGDVISAARIAGIQAAKRTAELIPLCHNIFISGIDISIILNKEDKSVNIKSVVKTIAVTGVEMEALTAVSVAALTVYDMCKALDKSICITDIKLLSKSGGKSGNYKRIN